jgi:hypothetical protein
MKYNLPQEVSFNDEVVYQSCFRICNIVNYKCNKCKLKCDKCLYSTSYTVCIKDIAMEIMKNLEKKYNIDGTID